MVAFVIYAILRGHLIPQRTIADWRADKDKQITELGQVVDLWRNAATVKDEALRELIPMLTELKENDKLIVQLLGALKEVADHKEAM